MSQYLHEVVVTAIIIKDGKYLITRRSPNKKRFPGMWTVPGGRLEADDYLAFPKDTEHYWYNVLEKTLKREVSEEVGLEVNNITYVTSLATVHADLPAPQQDTFYVYAIKCEGGSLYIGQTEDLKKRWQGHIAGTAAEWTKKYKPIYVVHHEEYSTREEAVKREQELKTGFGRKWLKREIETGRARQAGGAPSLVISCMGEWISGEVKLQEEETDKFAWVSLEEAKEYPLIDGIYDELAMASARREGKPLGEWSRENATHS